MTGKVLHFGYHQLLADQAHDATTAGMCGICGGLIRKGADRIARLPSGDWAHTPCIGRT